MPSPQPVPVDDITNIGAVCSGSGPLNALPVGGAERTIVMEARRRGLAITRRQEEHGRMGGV